MGEYEDCYWLEAQPEPVPVLNPVQRALLGVNICTEHGWILSETYIFRGKSFHLPWLEKIRGQMNLQPWDPVWG